MPITVVNTGIYERDTSGRRTTNQRQSFTDQGTVRVEYQGIQYVFGPGQSRDFSDAGIAAAVAAGDGRLRVADTREGKSAGGAS